VGGPEEITAVWRSDDTVQLVLIVGAVAAAVIVAFFTFMINVRKRKSVQQAKGVSYGRGVGV
jgi:heme/copper-type cytochrome/quinol oxidase subunit 2